MASNSPKPLHMVECLCEGCCLPVPSQRSWGTLFLSSVKGWVNKFKICPLGHFYIWQVSAIKKKRKHMLTQAQIISVCRCYWHHWCSCFSRMLCPPVAQEGICWSRGTPSGRKMLAWGLSRSRGSAHYSAFLKCWYIPILNTHPSKPQHLATEEHPVRKYLIHIAGGFMADMDESLWSLSLSWQTDRDRCMLHVTAAPQGWFNISVLRLWDEEWMSGQINGEPLWVKGAALTFLTVHLSLASTMVLVRGIKKEFKK